jgi:hypothetical protein
MILNILAASDLDFDASTRISASTCGGYNTPQLMQLSTTTF